MECQSLINEDSDIDNALLSAEPVPWAKDPLNLTADECWLRLLHVHIKHRAVVLFNSSFEALPRDSPPRPLQLRLPESFTNTPQPGPPIDFFKPLMDNGIIDILVQNTNAKASVEEAGTGRLWKPVDRHDILV